MDVQVACLCPGTPHAQDTITLRDVLDFRTGKAIRYSVQLLDADERRDTALVLAILTEGYLLRGVESWTLVDELGKPVPVNQATITERLLSQPTEAEKVSDAADELYSGAVMVPLLAMGSPSSPTGPTEPSTSQTNGSAPKPPKRSKQSSTSTTRTGGTALTSV